MFRLKIVFYFKISLYWIKLWGLMRVRNELLMCMVINVRGERVVVVRGCILLCDGFGFRFLVSLCNFGVLFFFRKFVFLFVNGDNSSVDFIGLL